MVSFAGPPFAMYPTVVAPAPDGSVYVGTDLNLAQGAVKGRGRVVRLVDGDGDGHADAYTIFAELDSPRGIAVDGNTVYVLHPPDLTAFRDTNGDGIADTSEVLVKDIGFSLDVRSSDHATNNITLGPDGWIYVAVGDNGYLNATGKDGARITQLGGSLVRVRPDGTGLEKVTIGTRNIYDVGIDPFAHAFTRDNTNDGRGWNTRFHWLAPEREHGLPIALPELRGGAHALDRRLRRGLRHLGAVDPGSRLPRPVEQLALHGRLDGEPDLPASAGAKGRELDDQAERLHDGAAPDRHGDGRPVAPLRGEPDRRRVQLRRRHGGRDHPPEPSGQDALGGAAAGDAHRRAIAHGAGVGQRRAPAVGAARARAPRARSRRRPRGCSSTRSTASSRARRARRRCSRSSCSRAHARTRRSSASPPSRRCASSRSAC